MGSHFRRGLLIAGLVLAFAAPGFAVSGLDAVPVDPAAAPMLWHILAAAAVVSIVQWRRIDAWLRNHAGLRSRRSYGFVFAASFAVLSTPLALNLVNGQPLPRFNDIYLVGIVLTCYFFTWEPAACLLFASVLISAWVLPPNGTLRVEGFTAWYRLTSFTIVSAIMILLIARMKAHRLREDGSAPAIGIQTAAGAD